MKGARRDSGTTCRGAPFWKCWETEATWCLTRSSLARSLSSAPPSATNLISSASALLSLTPPIPTIGYSFTNSLSLSLSLSLCIYVCMNVCVLMKMLLVKFCSVAEIIQRGKEKKEAFFCFVFRFWELMLHFFLLLG